MKFDEAYNKHDAAAVAALYKPEAVEVVSWETGPGAFPGQPAIEKRYAVELAAQPTKLVNKLVQLYAIDDNNACAITEWSVPPWEGYAVRVYAREGDAWKIRTSHIESVRLPR